jgi:chromosome segregation ATPase
MIMKNTIDDLLGDLDQTQDETTIDHRIRLAVIAGDADQVAQLLKVRDRADLEITVKRVADLQAQLFAVEAERESLSRELQHLDEPVRVAAKAYAETLETLEHRHNDLAQLQLRQATIDLGLESRREQINELRGQLNELMEEIS